MSSKTTNFNLHKIDLTDAPPDITVLNENWDKIDTRMSNIVTYYNADKSADDLTDPLALIPLNSTLNGELYAILGGTYAYVETIFYSSISTTSRRMQVAYSYNSGKTDMAMRVYSSNGWLAWTKIANSDDLAGNAPDLSGVVAKSGDTMTGNLVIKNATPELKLDDTSGVGGTRLYKNASTDVDYGTYLMDTSNSDGTYDILVLNRDEKVKGKLYIRSQTEDGSSTTTYEVYGEHNNHIKLKTYSALSEIGLTAGSETIQSIATNLPNNSILVCGITTNHAAVYPSNYGLLTVKRSSGTRIEFDFVTTAGASYHAFYSITSSGDSWTGWHELAKASAVAKIQTGSYTGTGTVGAANPMSLTFKFAPKIVMFVAKIGSSGSVTTYRNNYSMAYMDSVTTAYTNTPIFGDVSSGANNYVKKSADGKTISWYYSGSGSANGSQQFNQKDYTYHWVAIG